MTYNTTTVSSQKPNSSGNITLNISNLDDLSGTLAAGTYLVYNGSDFVVTNTPGTGAPSIFIGDGGTSNYPKTLSLNDKVCFYSSSPFNQIPGATLNLLSGETNWYESVTLPAGKYYIRGTCVGDFTSSANPNMTYRFKTAASYYGILGASYDDIASGGSYPYESVAMLSLTSTSTIFLNIDTISSANSTTTSNQSKYGHLFVMQVKT